MMNTSSTISTLTTTTSVIPIEPTPIYLGYLTLLICVLFFGSNTLPIKKFETGDGVFYQLCVCLSIWSVGIIVNFIRDFPTLYFLPMVGGFFWTTACINNVPMIKMIGLGMSTLISGTVAIVVGWANARFGLLGTKPEHPSNPIMNYFGVSLCAVSAIFYIFVKSESQPINTSNENEPLLRNSNNNNLQYNSLNTASSDNIEEIPIIVIPNESEYYFDRLNPNIKRTLGTILSIVAGIFLALAYVPYLYVMDNYENVSQNSLDYIFSMYCGILLSSLFYFAIYCLFKRNKPFVNIKAIFPGFINGWIWGIANCSFLFSNTILSQAVTFPIAGSVPSMIAALYGIFLFKEIKGKRNFFILIIGFISTILGSILCGLSK